MMTEEMKKLLDRYDITDCINWCQMKRAEIDKSLDYENTMFRHTEKLLKEFRKILKRQDADVG